MLFDSIGFLNYYTALFSWLIVLKTWFHWRVNFALAADKLNFGRCWQSFYHGGRRVNCQLSRVYQKNRSSSFIPEPFFLPLTNNKFFHHRIDRVAWTVFLRMTLTLLSSSSSPSFIPSPIVFPNLSELIVLTSFIRVV